MASPPADRRSTPLPSARRLVAGGGRYVANVSAPGTLHAAFVRSVWAHATIGAIDPGPALAVPGVRAVFCLADLERLGVGKLPVGWVLPGQHAVANDVLARGRVRYVGEPVAVVVAASPAAAEEGAEAVSVAYDPLVPVTSVGAALAPGAPLLHDDWGENVMARYSVDTGDAEAAFAGAAVVVADRFHVGRTACAPMEGRGAVASYDRFTGEITLVSSTQCPHHVRGDLAACLGRPEGSIRVVAPDVGGSFGAKDNASGPEAVLCLLAAHLGAPVRWIEGRGEQLAATGHSREQVFEVELAADGQGRVLAIRGRVLLDAGAYSSIHGMGTAVYAVSLLPGPYRIESCQLEALGVMTNKAPSGAYRGYGAPEATFVIEGLLDRLARRLGLDPVEIRRRNLLSPGAFPYRTATGLVYDDCDLPALLDRALESSGYHGFRAASRAGEPGQPREGMGIACCVLMGGFGPSREAADAGMRFGGYESAAVRVDADGRATVFTGLPTQGQGLDGALAQICAARLGIDPEQDVRVVAGDTAVTPYSPAGPIASRGAAVGGSAVHRAADAVARDLERAAGVLLEAPPSLVELTGGRAVVRGAPGPGLPLAEVASAVKRGILADQGVDPALEAVCSFEPSDQTYSFGVHVARVRLDPETGLVSVSQYHTVSDCGTLINPAVVKGQIVGGVVQGIGGALTEEAAYSAEGQPLATTPMDYLVPTALEAPPVEAEFTETPTPRTPTGARGAGELGIIGPAAAIAGAIADAVGPGRAFPARTPMTPERVWRLLADPD